MEDGSIDAGLELLSRATPRGMIRTQEEIAYACGCSRGYIWAVEREALKKLRRHPGLLRLFINERHNQKDRTATRNAG